MRNSGAPSIGDLVVAIYDERRGLKCVGLVIDCRGVECRIRWGSRSDPIGWWRRDQIRVISSALTDEQLDNVVGGMNPEKFSIWRARKINEGW